MGLVPSRGGGGDISWDVGDRLCGRGGGRCRGGGGLLRGWLGLVLGEVGSLGRRGLGCRVGSRPVLFREGSLNRRDLGARVGSRRVLVRERSGGRCGRLRGRRRRLGFGWFGSADGRSRFYLVGRCLALGRLGVTGCRSRFIALGWGRRAGRLGHRGRGGFPPVWRRHRLGLGLVLGRVRLVGGGGFMLMPGRWWWRLGCAGRLRWGWVPSGSCGGPAWADWPFGTGSRIRARRAEGRR